MAFVLLAQAAGSPTAPTIASSAVGQTSVAISLVTPSTDGVYGIIGYRFFYGTSGPNGPWTSVLVDPNLFPYTLSGLSPSTSYWIYAVGVAGNPGNQVSSGSNILSIATTGGYAPNFPRIGGHFIGSASGPYSPQQPFWDYCRYLNGPVVIGGDFDSGFSANPFGNKNFCLNYAKSNSNNGALYIQYGIWDHTEYTDGTHSTPQPRYATWQAQVLANNWNLRDSWPAGSFVNQIPSGAWVLTNSNLAVAADAGTGLKLEAYSWNWAIGRFLNGSFSNSSALLDGLYRDNSGATAEKAGDYTLSGSSQTVSAATPGVIAGIANGCDYARANVGNRYVMGNHSGWSAASASPPQPDISGYVNKWHGGFSEALIGRSGVSFESFGGFALIKQIYQNWINAYLKPKLFLFCHSALAADGTDQDSATPAYSVLPYQAMRYGFATCLQDNGWYTPCTLGYGYQNTWWFDEFGVDPSTGICQPFASAKPFVGWMGSNWIDNPWTTIIASGKTLYARRILLSNGKTAVAIANPKGNGVVTVDTVALWGKTFKRLTGNLNPTVNTGLTGNPQLQDRDGIIGFLQ